jgi:integrating conjugative element protein (TIGR03761 family)
MVMSKKNKEKPGRLVSQSSIILQTIPAQNAFANNKRNVLDFSSLVINLIKSARQDDPYADLYLLRIYQKILKARGKIRKLEEEHLKVLRTADGFKVKPSLTNKPVEYPLRFSNPYSLMCAYLVLDFDRLVRVLITAKYMFLIGKDKYRALIKEAKEAMQEVLSLPLEWFYTGVSRYDVRHNTPLAERAYKKMGEVDGKILMGTLRAPFAPKITPKGGETTEVTAG